MIFRALLKLIMGVAEYLRKWCECLLFVQWAIYCKTQNSTFFCSSGRANLGIESFTVLTAHLRVLRRLVSQICLNVARRSSFQDFHERNYDATYLLRKWRVSQSYKPCKAPTQSKKSRLQCDRRQLLDVEEVFSVRNDNNSLPSVGLCDESATDSRL